MDHDARGGSVRSRRDRLVRSSREGDSGNGSTKPVRHADYVVCTRQKDSVLELFQSSPRYSLGCLPLHGPLNLGRTRPTGLAYSPDLGLLAVATRSGTIHLIELIPRFDSSDFHRVELPRPIPKLLSDEASTRS